MNEEKKKISVTHVNIRLSISMLLLKLILIELFAGMVIIAWLFLISLYSGAKDISLLHSIVNFGLPILFAFVAIKTFITVFLTLQWLNEYYEISIDMIKYCRGIIFRRVDDYPTADIKFIEVNQSPLGKLLNFGTITILNVRRIELAQMYLIHNPMRYAKVIEDIVPNLIERKRMIRKHFHENEDETAGIIYGNM